MSALKTLYNEVELLVQYPEVGLAISDSAAPVPGYLYGEINAVTYINYGNNCKPLVNFLVSRLQPGTPLVAIKILKLLLYLVKNGHTEIVEEVKYQEVALKEAMGFHGPPDDLHGKAFYENIRKLAKELLDFIFSENREVSDASPPPVLELTGYGSNANTKGLSGFGFSVKSQKSISEKITDGVTSFVDKLLPSNDKEQAETQASHLGDSLPQYKPLIINKDSAEIDMLAPASTQNVTQKLAPVPRSKRKARVYKPGKPGGGWDDSDDEEEEDVMELAREDISKCSSVSFDCIDISKVEVKDSVIDWVDEHKVVDSFTLNEPLHKIDYSSITSLCKSCSSLNCDKILAFLLSKLEEKEELVQLHIR
ncbi:AP-4 complex accessory subunit Tepsin isoform X2 [Parasteatoda tepidariorum]|uniref:AP-4 complex accessory subunit Tepsin isoform X2 n=1 Tax=Parasteatoda tepidariorum TaxID=114398 RepID=UPI0039BD7FF3